MNEQTFSPDDPRLTAYALGELSGEELAAVETLLKNDPAAQAVVEEIRALATQLEGALAQEALMDPVADAEEGAELAEEAKRVEFSRAADVEDDPYRKKATPFPYVWVGTLAAACFAVVFALQQGERDRGGSLAKNEPAAIPAEAAATLEEADALAGRARDRAFAETTAAGVFLVKDADEAARLPSADKNATSAGASASSTTSGAVANSEGLTAKGARQDTAGYADLRWFLDQGIRPPRDAVRVEEMVNSFHYQYTAPTKEVAEPFAASMEIATAPWNPAHRLVRIGLKGRETATEERPAVEKRLVERVDDTPDAIAKDVKLQVAFNPAVAQAYRLIGYENRTPTKEAFNNDTVDAGEIGAGHTMTALYEIVPVGAPAPVSSTGEIDALKYQTTETVAAAEEVAVKGEVVATSESPDGVEEVTTGMGTSVELSVEDVGMGRELLTLKIRFKEPTVDVSRKMVIPVIDTGAAFEAASKDFKFAAAVASLGLMLRESSHTVAADYDRVISWAEAGKGDDADGERGEFIELVKKARALSAE